MVEATGVSPEAGIAQRGERLTTTVGAMLNKKCETELERDGTVKQPATAAKRALRTYFQFSNLAPFQSEEGIDVDRGEPLLMPKLTVPVSKEGGEEGETEDRTFKPGELKVVKIMSLDENEDYHLTLEYRDEEDNVHTVEDVAVQRQYLVDAQIATGELDDLFPDGSNERQALEVYRKSLPQVLQDGEPPALPPDDVLDSLEQKYLESPKASGSTPEQAPTGYEQVNAEIALQASELRRHIETIKDEGEKKTAQNLLLELEVAEMQNGEWGAFYKLNALMKIQQDLRRRGVTENITKQIDALDPMVQTAKDSLLQYLVVNANGDQKTFDGWIEIANTKGPIELLKVLQQQDMPDVIDKVFGASFDQARLSKIIEDSHLTPEEKAFFAKYGKYGKGALWILAAIVGLPIALATGATLALAGAATKVQ